MKICFGIFNITKDKIQPKIINKKKNSYII